MSHVKKPLLLGAHISVAGGFDQAIKRGESIGCTVIQIFTKSNRQWFAKEIDQSSIDIFKETHKKSFIETIVAHAAYLINIGSSNPEVQKKSTDALISELKRCSLLSIPYLILHPGSKGESGEKLALAQITSRLNDALAATPKDTTILLETMAGQGSNLCYTFEQLATIYQGIKDKSRIGICFDTCHAFAAGYDFRTPEKYEALWRQFDEILGLELIKVIHINDSKKEIGSRVDRHEHIGKGQLGLKPFEMLFNDPRFHSIPKILETPKENLADDLKNMQQITQLIKQENKKVLDIYVPEEIFEAKSK